MGISQCDDLSKDYYMISAIRNSIPVSKISSCFFLFSFSPHDPCSYYYTQIITLNDTWNVSLFFLLTASIWNIFVITLSWIVLSFILYEEMRADIVFLHWWPHHLESSLYWKYTFISEKSGSSNIDTELAGPVDIPWYDNLIITTFDMFT